MNQMIENRDHLLKYLGSFCLPAKLDAVEDMYQTACLMALEDGEQLGETSITYHYCNCAAVEVLREERIHRGLLTKQVGHAIP